ncbi:hypothetical protein LBMAG42_15230 [Deltaproteobacteria bacterium]|nr:hypothetical protein LBMAG42_15230 [Deltaproteobacteria bacterium]
MPVFVGSFRGVTAVLSISTAALLCLATVSTFGLRASRLLPTASFPKLWLWWMRVWFPSYFYRYIPGKVMLVAERVRLGARLGIPPATSVLLVVWESGLLVAGSAVFGAVGLLIRPPDGGLVSPPAVVALAAISLVGCLAFPLVLRTMVRWFPALGARIPGLALEVPAAAQLGLILGNAGCWCLLGVSFALTARLFEGGGDVDVASLVIWFVGSYVVGQVSSVTPAGIGVREAVLVAGLAGIAPAPLVLAWAIANRLVLAAVEGTLLLGSLALPFPQSPPDGEEATR